jgi:hypothetical protein
MLVHDGLHRFVPAVATNIGVQFFGSAGSRRSQLANIMRKSRHSCCSGAIFALAQYKGDEDTGRDQIFSLS